MVLLMFQRNVDISLHIPLAQMLSHRLLTAALVGQVTVLCPFWKGFCRRITQTLLTCKLPGTRTVRSGDMARASPIVLTTATVLLDLPDHLAQLEAPSEIEAGLLLQAVIVTCREDRLGVDLEASIGVIATDTAIDPGRRKVGGVTGVGVGLGARCVAAPPHLDAALRHGGARLVTHHPGETIAATGLGRLGATMIPERPGMWRNRDFDLPNFITC